MTELSEKRLGEAMAGLGRVLRELGNELAMAAQESLEQADTATRLERPAPAADDPLVAGLPRCPNCQHPFSVVVSGPSVTEPPATVALASASEKDLLREIRAVAFDVFKAPETVGVIIRQLFEDFEEDLPDPGQAPSNKGNGPVPLFLDGDGDDPEDEVLAEQGEFQLGGDGRG